MPCKLVLKVRGANRIACLTTLPGIDAADPRRPLQVEVGGLEFSWVLDVLPVARRLCSFGEG